MNKDANTRRHQIRELLKHRTDTSAMSALEIHNELKSRGFDYVKKTIERDLKKLSSSFGLCSTGSNPERYFAPGDFNFDQDITLDFNSLETLYIALQNLKETSHEYFSDQVRECEAVLMSALNQDLVGELEYSRDKYHFDYGLSGKPVEGNNSDVKSVLDALRDEKFIKCKNISPYGDENDKKNQRIRNLAPLDFVLSSGMPYLIARDLDDIGHAPKRFRLSRLKEVSIGEIFEREDYRSNYDRNSYIGGWGGPGTECIDLKIHADKLVGTFFSEKILHPTQVVEKLNDDEYHITMTVPLSSELIRILASFGGSIHHVHPKEAFDKIQAIWESGIERQKKKLG